MKFIGSSPDLGLSGANTFLATLLDGCSERGHEAIWILTSYKGENRQSWINNRKFEIDSLPPTKLSDYKARQTAFADILGQEKDTYYFPNYDGDMFYGIPSFPSSARTIFVVHSDDPVYYDLLEKHEDSFDAIVAVSQFLTQNLKQHRPHLEHKVHSIPYGVDLPELSRSYPDTIDKDRPLRVVYSGRIVQEQKRVRDLATLILECHRTSLPVSFQIAGDGPHRKQFLDKIEPALESGSAEYLGLVESSRILELYQTSDVIVLTSEFEGLPLCLLEAMAAGCVPVVTDIKSGVPELIPDDSFGARIEIGDIDAFVEKFQRFIDHPELLKGTSQNARRRIIDGGYTKEANVTSYIELCQSLPAQAPRPNRPVPTCPPQYTFPARLKAFLALNVERVRKRLPKGLGYKAPAYLSEGAEKW